MKKGATTMEKKTNQAKGMKTIFHADNRLEKEISFARRAKRGQRQIFFFFFDDIVCPESFLKSITFCF